MEGYIIEGCENKLFLRNESKGSKLEGPERQNFCVYGGAADWTHDTLKLSATDNGCGKPPIKIVNAGSSGGAIVLETFFSLLPKQFDNGSDSYFLLREEASSNSVWLTCQGTRSWKVVTPRDKRKKKDEKTSETIS